MTVCCLIARASVVGVYDVHDRAPISGLVTVIRDRSGCEKAIGKQSFLFSVKNFRRFVLSRLIWKKVGKHLAADNFLLGFRWNVGRSNFSLCDNCRTVWLTPAKQGATQINFISSSVIKKMETRLFTHEKSVAAIEDMLQRIPSHYESSWFLLNLSQVTWRTVNKTNLRLGFFLSAGRWEPANRGTCFANVACIRVGCVCRSSVQEIASQRFFGHYYWKHRGLVYRPLE